MSGILENLNDSDTSSDEDSDDGEWSVDEFCSGEDFEETQRFINER